MRTFTSFIIFHHFSIFTKFTEKNLLYMGFNVWYTRFLSILSFLIFTKFTRLNLLYKQAVVHIKDQGFERSLRTLSIFRIMDIRGNLS